MLADILLSIGSGIFTFSIIPQIKKTIMNKSADQFSWFFLIMIIIALDFFIVGKFLVGCYIAAILDFLGLLGYGVLFSLKLFYSKRREGVSLKLS